MILIKFTHLSALVYFFAGAVVESSLFEDWVSYVN